MYLRLGFIKGILSNFEENNKMEVFENIKNPFTGIIIGTSVGDSIGLPYEGMTLNRVGKLYKKEKGQSLIFNRGLTSDDTDHTCMVAEALLETDDVEGFRNCLAQKLKMWLLSLPAGIGFGTLKALIKLLLGVSPLKSGVNSAGNGPAMRSAIIGYAFKGDIEKIKAYVKASTFITHQDKRAYCGALAVALSASYAVLENKIDTKKFLDFLRTNTSEIDENFTNILNIIEEAYLNGLSPRDFIIKMGFKNGVSGYVYSTVPAAIYLFLKYNYNFESAINTAVLLGKDTDTLSAIVGAIIGARVGVGGIPKNWMSNLAEWPRTVRWQIKLGDTLKLKFDKGEKNKKVAPFWPFFLLRNLLFIPVVIWVIIKRCFPPY